MIFNINEEVMVRLTDAGRKELERQAEEFRQAVPDMGSYTPRKEDSEGFSTFQLWVLMETFGHMLGMTADVPFETDIKFNIKQPTEKAPCIHCQGAPCKSLCIN